jgi:hypothetical protein
VRRDPQRLLPVEADRPAIHVPAKTRQRRSRRTHKTVEPSSSDLRGVEDCQARNQAMARRDLATRAATTLLPPWPPAGAVAFMVANGGHSSSSGFFIYLIIFNLNGQNHLRAIL